jgi:hypothetical protein
MIGHARATVPILSVAALAMAAVVALAAPATVDLGYG